MKKAIYLLLVSMLFVTACTEQAPRIAKYTDLYAVKGTDSLFLDRYTAVSVEQDDARPCLVFVFGGGFIAGERDAERYLPFFHYMVNQGYDVVSIDYRLGLKQVVASGDLSPENMMLGMARTISMAVEDLYDATAFIVDKADEWGIDSSQIVACGSSAGAITVLHGEYALCNASPLVQHLPVGFRYAGIVSFAGAIFEMGEELRWASQPAPMMLFHGDADANECDSRERRRFLRLEVHRRTAPRDELPVLFLFGRERLTRHRHGADGRQPGCDRCFPLETRRG